MPYIVKGNTVYKKDTGKPVKGGHHKNHADAVRHMKALYANVEDAHETKSDKKPKKHRRFDG